MKLNYNFAKPALKADGTPDYAPTVIRVPTHHHEEWDEPVIDPETGEPTGETEHKSRDWDTWRTEGRPTAADYHAAGFIDVLNNPAPSDAPTGHHYEFSGWEIVDSAIRRVYVLVDDPPPPPRVFDPYKLMDELMKRNVWDAVKEWLQAKPEGWDRWSKAPDIDEGEPLFKSAVDAAKTAFGWSDADVEAILAASVKEGA